MDLPISLKILKIILVMTKKYCNASQIIYGDFYKTK